MISSNTYQGDFIITKIYPVHIYTRKRDNTIQQDQLLLVVDKSNNQIYKIKLIHEMANHSFVLGDIIRMTYTVNLYNSNKQPGKIVPDVYAKSILPLRTVSPYPWLTPEQVAQQLRFEQTQILPQNENNFSDKYNIYNKINLKNNMVTKDMKIVKIEGIDLYQNKYHELTRKMFLEVVDIHDEDINFLVALYPPYSYNYLEPGDKIRLTFKMKTGRNKKSNILNNYIYADDVLALQTASSQPWMTEAETIQTRENDEKDTEADNQEKEKANEELKN